MAGLVVVILVCLLAVMAPVIAGILGHGPNALFSSSLSGEFALPTGPSARFLFGVDADGRDLFIRVIYGLRTSLLVSVTAAIIATAIGLALGVMAGFLGGWVDTVISRLIDIFLSFPLILFAVSVSSVCSTSANGCLDGTMSPGVGMIVTIIVLVSWPYIARILRGEALRLRHKEFVESAECVGSSTARVILRDIMPNLVPPTIIYLTLAIPSNILFEAVLSFLGVGIPQSTPSLGGIISSAVQGNIFAYAWWLIVFPGIFLLLATLSFNLVGDGLRDALEP
jgi:peptide/nickel transport system permease protein